MPTPTISIEGIDEVTLYELSQHLPPESASAKSSASGGQAGELATTIVILVAVPIKGFVDWLMKDRTDGRRREDGRDARQIGLSLPGRRPVRCNGRLAKCSCGI